MQKHPTIGAEMIEKHSALKEAAPLVRHHHERWDGTGYPSGLKGDTIPLGARILSVADSFDTITGPRVYRQSKMTLIEGVEDISRRSGHWYDPNVVDALREIYGLPAMDFAARPNVPRRITSLRVMRASPPFTRLFAAIGVSSLGDPLTQVATLVAIYSATGQAGAVALGFIAQALGTIVMSGALGGIADRFTRRPLLVTLELLRAAILVALALVGPSVWLIVPVLFVLAMINAIVQPARQAAVPSLVPAGLAGRANAMVATVGTLAGAAGFGLAGLILALTLRSYGTRVLFLNRCRDLRDCRRDHAGHSDSWGRRYHHPLDRSAQARMVDRSCEASPGHWGPGRVSACNEFPSTFCPCLQSRDQRCSWCAGVFAA